MSTPLRPLLGSSEFREFREAGTYYADKTSLISGLLDLPERAVLFPRPRRFGKSTNLSMLRTFFEKTGEDVSPLFTGLAIWSAGERYRAHLQRHPVIHLSFKDAKARSFADCRGALQHVLAAECERHREALFAPGLLSDPERAEMLALMSRQADNPTLWAALRTLSRHLHRAYGQQVVILLDEYDVPILSGFLHGFYDDITELLRNLLAAGLKDNPHLFKGVLTGVLRIAKENLFSGLNNLMVFGLMEEEFATAFGFTEKEVEELLRLSGHPEAMSEVAAWYNGYNFGGQVIYNPWSVLSYARNPRAGFQPYWVQTSSDDVLRELIWQRAFYVLPEFKRLLQGESIEQPVSDRITLRGLYGSPAGVFTLLLHAGYLKHGAVRYDAEEAQRYAELRIPNREVRHVFIHSILSWVASGEQGSAPLDQLLSALLAGDTEIFASRLLDLALRVLSFDDTEGPEPEKVYQAFALGLLVKLLSRYEVDSNREAGLGRYDILVLPREAGQPGAVLEFKVAKSGSAAAVRSALREALQQIERKGYAERLRERGASPMLRYGVACHGKQVWVLRAGAGEKIYGAPLAAVRKRIGR